MYVFIALVLITGVARLIISQKEKTSEVPSDQTTVATTTAATTTIAETEKEPAPTNANVNLTFPQPYAVVTSPLNITGEARVWFFEGSFPITLNNWDGLTIAQGIATAKGDWMTADFVPFTASLEFTNPYKPGDPDFMKKGTLILKKDNPSDLPELDDSLEIPISFAP